MSEETGRVTERGTYQCPCGREHGLLPEQPPESPPNTFHCAAGCGRIFEVNADECAAYYRAQGKTLPDAVQLVLPDGTTETHDWAGYGHRFREAHRQGSTAVRPAGSTTAPASGRTQSGAPATAPGA